MSKLLIYCLNIRAVFTLALIIRLLLSPESHVDEQRYLWLSDQIVAGNFDLDAGSFLCAPFFPYFLASLKIISPQYWSPWLFICQALLSSLCVFCLYQMALWLFNNKNIALLSGFIYAVYLDAFMYVRLIGQETCFQSFLIFSLYFLFDFIISNNGWRLVLSAVFFSLSFLTKSFILFWSPFIVLFIFLQKNFSIQQKIRFSFLYALVCLIFTLPIGMYNLNKHGLYTLSSNGGSFLFWVGNSEYAYTAAVLKKDYAEVYPEMAARDEVYQMHNLVPPTADLNKFLTARKTWGTVQDIQNKFGQAAWKWVFDNPKKFWILRGYNFVRFLIPGSKSPNAALFTLFFTFLSAGILYVAAFLGMIKCLNKQFTKHNWILTLYLTMLIFSIIFGTYIRFRTVTIDSFLILYASFFLYETIQNFKRRWRTTTIHQGRTS
ncbi:MAG: glycosyltransferase family 39 protein [Saprospiraceae bacterium]|nr:glycosyltransferase family 39 protein [Saprospiraceae bacterium]